MSISLQADPSLAQGYIKVNGTTAATFTTSGITLPSGGAVTFPDGTTQTSGKGPAFSAYQSSAQTLSASTWTKIQLQTKEFDTNSNFDASTNYRFTPTIAGYYQINGGVAVSATATQVIAAIYKNGSVAKQGGFNQASGVLSAVAAVVYMNGSTDYVEFYSNVSAAQALAAGSTVTYFQGFLARPA